MDSRPVNPTLPIIQQVQIVAKLVPISQIRTMVPPGATQQTIPFDPSSDLGRCTRVSIILACSHPRLARSRQLSRQTEFVVVNASPSRLMPSTITVVRSRALPSLGIPLIPMAVHFFPHRCNFGLSPCILIFEQTNRSWWLLSGGGDVAANANPFDVRCNLKCDQHFVYSDPHLATQDLTYAPLTGYPDDR